MEQPELLHRRATPLEYLFMAEEEREEEHRRAIERIRRMVEEFRIKYGRA